VDLLTTWRLIQQAVTNQIQTLKGNSAKDRIRTPLDLDRAVYQPCFGHITVAALLKAQHHYISTKKPLKECTGVFTTTTGLPCAHTINDRQATGLVLLPADFHLHWHWDRYSIITPLILEPLQIISRTTTTSTSTRRLPSGFEASEPRVRLCSQCKLPGHNRASPRCLINLRRSIQEIDPNGEPSIASTPSSSLFIPRDTIQSIVDSAGNNDSALKSGL
jgi:hypothetical protein